MKNPDGKVGISLQSYTLEYQFERVLKRKIYGKPSNDGLPLITNVPKDIIKKLLSDIGNLPIGEFEEFNRCIQNLKNSHRLLGNLKIGKTIQLPFLKDPGDFRTPSSKIIELQTDDHNKYGCVNLEISLYHCDVINKLPKVLDTITIFFCLLCFILNYSPNKITFNLIRPFCEDKDLSKLNDYLQKEPIYKLMRVKPGLTSLYSIKTGDIEFSVWKNWEWVLCSFSFFRIQEGFFEFL